MIRAAQAAFGAINRSARPKRSWRAMHPLERSGIYLFAFAFLALFGNLIASQYWLPPPNLNPATLAIRLDRNRVLLHLMHGALACMYLSAVFQPTGRYLAFRALRRRGFLTCPGCNYDLAQTRRAPRCPECGRTFGPKGVVREWARILPRRGRGFELATLDRHPEPPP